MSQALSSQRSWIARIAVLGMLASLLAFGAAPAGAAIDTSGSCPASIPDAGFTDLAGVPAAAVDAINCIAEYGISTGTTATTFDPFADVQRWQMALFLTRQAAIHGVTLPDGSDQGFTDLGGVPAAAVTAINQTAQLGISTGTSATTFDPFANVERWQMALFLTRLITGAGLTLPAGADQGFTDLAGVPAAAVTAINQLGELDIADGTTATTFDPFADVERWAMALFLTRVLAADGITPPVTGTFAFSPNGGQSDAGDAVEVTVSNAVAGVEHTIALIPVGDVDGVVFVDDDDNDEADGVDGTDEGWAEITVVAGADVADDTIQTVTPTGSTFTLSIDSGDEFDTFKIVVWADADSDGELDLNDDDEPDEAPFGVSGDFVLLPPEGELGEFYSGDLLFIDRDANFMIVDDGPVTLFYDDNDVYTYDGDFVMTMAQWELWASTDAENDGNGADYVTYDNFAYNPDSAGVSDFYLDDDYSANPDAPGAVVVDEDDDGDDDDLELSFDAPEFALNDADQWDLEICDEDDCGGGAAVTNFNIEDGHVEEDLPDGDWYVRVRAQSETGDQSDWSDTTAFTIETGETTAPTVEETNLVTDNATVGFLDDGDVFEHIFSEDMADTLGSSNATFLRISDSNSTYQVACVDQATCVLDDLEDDGVDTNGDADDRLTLTLIADPVFVSGTEDGLDIAGDTATVVFVSAAFDDESGNQLDAAGSADLTID